jgi:hypothetical protein
VNCAFSMEVLACGLSAARIIFSDYAAQGDKNDDGFPKPAFLRSRIGKDTIWNPSRSEAGPDSLVVLHGPGYLRCILQV